MNTNIINILRKIVPRKLQTLIKFYQIFNNTYGHSNTVDGLIKSGSNTPLPWITYPAIEFLNTIDFHNCDVFEFGSGSSTHFWAAKAKSVTSVEKDETWYQKVKKTLPPNCTLYFNSKDKEYVEKIKEQNRKYDIVVVDGAVRFPCTLAAIEALTDDGIILIDNSDWYPNSCSYLRDQGFIQIDFSGFSPLNAFTASTSLFYRKPSLLQRKILSVLPMGRRDIGEAYDDKPFNQIDKQFLNL